jgi:hypothetical protein
MYLANAVGRVEKVWSEIDSDRGAHVQGDGRAVFTRRYVLKRDALAHAVLVEHNLAAAGWTTDQNAHSVNGQSIPMRARH